MHWYTEGVTPQSDRELTAMVTGGGRLAFNLFWTLRRKRLSIKSDANYIHGA